MKYHYRWKRIALLLLVPVIAFPGMFLYKSHQRESIRHEYSMRVEGHVISVSSKVEKHNGPDRQEDAIEFPALGKKWRYTRFLKAGLAKGEQLRAWIHYRNPSDRVIFEKEFGTNSWGEKTFMQTPWQTIGGNVWLDTVGGGLVASLLWLIALMLCWCANDDKKRKRRENLFPPDPAPRPKGGMELALGSHELPLAS